MQYISDLLASWIVQIAAFMTGLWSNLQTSEVTWWQAGLDVLLVAIILYYILQLFKGSRSISILLGLIIISIVFIISKALNLLTLGWILDRFLTVVLVAIPVIFQPELRMALEKLGAGKIFGRRADVAEKMIGELVEAASWLADKKLGALIVLRGRTPLKEYIDTGVEVNSDVSHELLIAIFDGKGPLHDGAVILENGRIRAAACLLPAATDAQTKGLGTRHKAALALSRQTDAEVIVVSEEKGTISYAKDGHLDKGIDAVRLKHLLHLLLKPKKK